MELKWKSGSFDMKLLHALYQKPSMISSPLGTYQNQGPQQELEPITFISRPWNDWNLFQLQFSSLF